MPTSSELNFCSKSSWSSWSSANRLFCSSSCRFRTSNSNFVCAAAFFSSSTLSSKLTPPCSTYTRRTLSQIPVNRENRVELYHTTTHNTNEHHLLQRMQTLSAELLHRPRPLQQCPCQWLEELNIQGTHNSQLSTNHFEHLIWSWDTIEGPDCHWSTGYPI